MRRSGFLPSAQAGNRLETMIDLPNWGGAWMSRRRPFGGILSRFASLIAPSGGIRKDFGFWILDWPEHSILDFGFCPDSLRSLPLRAGFGKILDWPERAIL